MGRMGDVDYAASMRDKIIRISEGVVERLRPDVRIGKVFDFDVNSGQATVIFAGETGDSLTYVKFGKNMIPTSSIMMHQDPLAQAVDITVTADIVRIAGKPGAYYIDSFISGTPASWISMFDPNVAFGSGFNGQTAYDDVTDVTWIWSDIYGGWTPMGQSAWVTPTLASPYTQDAAQSTVKYKRDGQTCFITGAVFTNGATSGTTVFTLPAGFCPAQNWRYVNDTAPITTSTSRIVVQSDGQVKPFVKTGTPTEYFLDTAFPIG